MIKRLKTKGMRCAGCEKVIEKAALSVEGVSSARSSFIDEEVIIEFDENKTGLDNIIDAIKSKGYEPEVTPKQGGPSKNKKNPSKINPGYVLIAGALLGVLGLFWMIGAIFHVNVPIITPGMGLAVIFVVGLLTSFHCVGMCGGFVLSYTAKDAMSKGQSKRQGFLSHLGYGAGKTITYTALGALFGLIGSFVTFTPTLKGIAALIAGLFLVIYGLNMLKVLPFLRRLQFRGPRVIGDITRDSIKQGKGPFVIGLLNGLMIACGPLQAMLIYAAGTGSLLQGALALLVFGLGTLPLMLGFGSVTTIIGSKFTNKLLKVSAVIVILLGIIMINRGLSLAGTGYDMTTLITTVNAYGNVGTGNPAVETTLKEGYQEIMMAVDGEGFTPNKFVLKKGVPVRWIIDGKELNGCNNAIQVPAYGLNFKVAPGEQTIEFTPTEEGVVPWSCWMGMIKGTFIVKSDIDLTNAQEIQDEIIKIPEQPKGTCGCHG